MSLEPFLLCRIKSTISMSSTVFGQKTDRLTFMIDGSNECEYLPLKITLLSLHIWMAVRQVNKKQIQILHLLYFCWIVQYMRLHFRENLLSHNDWFHEKLEVQAFLFLKQRLSLKHLMSNQQMLFYDNKNDNRKLKASNIHYRISQG